MRTIKEWKKEETIDIFQIHKISIFNRQNHNDDMLE